MGQIEQNIPSYRGVQGKYCLHIGFILDKNRQLLPQLLFILVQICLKESIRRFTLNQSLSKKEMGFKVLSMVTARRF